MTQQTEKNQETNSSQSHIRQVRIQKMETLRERGLNPYPYGYDKEIMAQDLQNKYKDLAVGEETEDYYHVAGRVMACRNTGMFIDLVDASGKIQIFSHKENLSEEDLKTLKSIDIGDIVGFYGSVRRTPRGELTIKSTYLTVLSKSLLPLPEKFHGLTDVETKYRHRYVDMIINDDVKRTFQKRSLIIQKVREYLAISAPENPGVCFARNFLSKSFCNFKFLRCTSNISSRSFNSGRSTLICLSDRKSTR